MLHASLAHCAFRTFWRSRRLALYGEVPERRSGECQDNHHDAGREEIRAKPLQVVCIEQAGDGRTGDELADDDADEQTDHGTHEHGEREPPEPPDTPVAQAKPSY